METKKKKGGSDLETKRVEFAQIVAVCIDFQIFKMILPSASLVLLPPAGKELGGIRNSEV